MCASERLDYIRCRLTFENCNDAFNDCNGGAPDSNDALRECSNEVLAECQECYACTFEFDPPDPATRCAANPGYGLCLDTGACVPNETAMQCLATCRSSRELTECALGTPCPEPEFD